MENNNIVYGLKVGDFLVFEEHYGSYLNYVYFIREKSDNSFLVKMMSLREDSNYFGHLSRVATKCNDAFVFDSETKIKKISKREAANLYFFSSLKLLDLAEKYENYTKNDVAVIEKNLTKVDFFEFCFFRFDRKLFGEIL